MSMLTLEVVFQISTRGGGIISGKFYSASIMKVP